MHRHDAEAGVSPPFRKNLHRDTTTMTKHKFTFLWYNTQYLLT
jgi:hypothetical protein